MKQEMRRSDLRHVDRQHRGVLQMEAGCEVPPATDARDGKPLSHAPHPPPDAILRLHLHLRSAQQLGIVVANLVGEEKGS